MASMIEDIMGQLGEGGIGQISQSLGVDATEGSTLISSALPALLGGLANNTASADGASSLLGALDGHSGALDLGSLLGGDAADGGKVLGHVLGDRTEPVVNQLSGGDSNKGGLLMKLLPILAPIVMNYLASKRSSGGLDAGGLGGMLGSEAKSAATGSPNLGGLFDLIGGGGGGGLADILGSVTGGSSGGLGDVVGDVLGGSTEGSSKGGLMGMFKKMLGN